MLRLILVIIACVVCILAGGSLYLIVGVGAVGDSVSVLLPSLAEKLHLKKIAELTPALPLSTFVLGTMYIGSQLLKLRREMK